MIADWVVVGFLVLAIAERLYERRFSHAAARGTVKMSWSYRAFFALHTIIYLATGAEYFVLRRQAAGLVWLVTVGGLVVFIVSVWLRLLAIQTLGRYWSLNLEIRADHRLVTEGVYQFVRHPAYTAIMLEVIAIPLVGNAYWTLVLSALYVGLLLLRWRREEQEMVAKFGVDYERYRQDVPAFVPRLLKRDSP